MRVLISRGAEVNNHEPCNGDTALHAAAQEGHAPVIELLISQGARIDVRSKDALHQAAGYGHKEAAICLLDYEADFNAKDKEGVTPLFLAAQNGHLLFSTFLSVEVSPTLT